MAIRSDQLSPIAPPWNDEIPLSGPAIIRLEMACVYSCPITVASKSPSTHGGYAAPPLGCHMYMLVTGSMPSGGVAWLALLRMNWLVAPCWARPCSASPPLPYGPRFTLCRFQALSVNPRWYDQSCIRLCIAKRLVVAAS